MSRVAEAHTQFKRCCIAFAYMCCAPSRTADGCCESKCDATSDELVLLTMDTSDEPAYGNTNNEKAEMESVATLPVSKDVDVKDDTILEVVGMDCPDCHTKVTRAVDSLSGAKVTNADGVRGLVTVEYDSSKHPSSNIRVKAHHLSQIESI